MELFYGTVLGDFCRLDAEEAAHCVRVLRHRVGDEVSIIDGQGTLYRCRLSSDSPKGLDAQILESVSGWGSHPYELTMAVCPTKNMDRYEWFVEKATELGVDRIVPVIGDHSERRVLRTDRLRKILLSATKQSLKARIPALDEPVSVSDFIAGQDDGLRLVACCFEPEGRRHTIAAALEEYSGSKITILIGPEGDFSAGEVALALGKGFVPVSLGDSRLRTETAAVFATASVYYKFIK